MSQLKSFLLLCGLAFFFSTVSQAEIQWGTPSYVGSGCPEGSVETVLSPDQESIVLLFSRYSITVPPKRTMMKRCHLRIPISNIPNDKKVLITQSEFQGFLSLPKNAQSVFQAYFKLVRAGQILNFDASVTREKGPYEDNFYSEKTQTVGLNSGCGGNAQLEINTQIGILNNSKESASYTIDSTNVVSSTAVPFKIHLVNCRP